MKYSNLDKFFSESAKDNGHKKKVFTPQEINRAVKELNIDFTQVDRDQFMRGLEVELEHGTVDPNTDVSNDDVIITAKIALAHLNELPDYYTRLDKMEQEGEAALEKKQDEDHPDIKIPAEEKVEEVVKEKSKEESAINAKLLELYGLPLYENETIEKHSAYVFIFNKDKQILMLKRKESGWWGFPGGKVEKDETQRNAVIREAKEEVNIEISELIPISDYRDSTDRDGVKWIRNMFFAIKWEGEPKLMDTKDHSEMKWVSIDELYKDTKYNNAVTIIFKHNFNPYVRPLMDKYLK